MAVIPITDREVEAIALALLEAKIGAGDHAVAQAMVVAIKRRGWTMHPLAERKPTAMVRPEVVADAATPE